MEELDHADGHGNRTGPGYRTWALRHSRRAKVRLEGKSLLRSKAEQERQLEQLKDDLTAEQQA